MGKHAAPQQPRDQAPVPAALRQTMVFGGLAVAVAVVALAWAGAGAVTAIALGAGLLLLGAVVFLLVRRSGLLGAGAGSGGAEPTATPAPHP